VEGLASKKPKEEERVKEEDASSDVVA